MLDDEEFRIMIEGTEDREAREAELTVDSYSTDKAGIMRLMRQKEFSKRNSWNVDLFKNTGSGNLFNRTLKHLNCCDIISDAPNHCHNGKLSPRCIIHTRYNITESFSILLLLRFGTDIIWTYDIYDISATNGTHVHHTRCVSMDLLSSVLIRGSSHRSGDLSASLKGSPSHSYFDGNLVFTASTGLLAQCFN